VKDRVREKERNGDKERGGEKERETNRKRKGEREMKKKRGKSVGEREEDSQKERERKRERDIVIFKKLARVFKYFFRQKIFVVQMELQNFQPSLIFVSTTVASYNAYLLQTQILDLARKVCSRTV
jgi:hypothetical protein